MVSFPFRYCPERTVVFLELELVEDRIRYAVRLPKEVQKGFFLRRAQVFTCGDRVICQGLPLSHRLERPGLDSVGFEEAVQGSTEAAESLERQRPRRHFYLARNLFPRVQL